MIRRSTRNQALNGNHVLFFFHYVTDSSRRMTPLKRASSIASQSSSPCLRSRIFLRRASMIASQSSSPCLRSRICFSVAGWHELVSRHCNSQISSSRTDVSRACVNASNVICTHSLQHARAKVLFRCTQSVPGTGRVMEQEQCHKCLRAHARLH